jgi:hypothetical protein
MREALEKISLAVREPQPAAHDGEKSQRLGTSYATLCERVCVCGVCYCVYYFSC